jgi:RNA polymerase sigma factor for flagellar operon FliA
MLKTLLGLENQIAPTWKEYLQDRTIENRNRIIEHYYPLIQISARSLSKKFKNKVELEELCDYCTFGLIEAIEQYDETRSNTPIKYLIIKIKFIAISSIRNAGPIPREILALYKKYNNAIGVLRTQTGEPPKDEDIMEYLGLTIKELDALRKRIKYFGRIRNFTSFSSEEYLNVPPVVVFLSSKKSYTHFDNHMSFQETIQSLNILSKKQKQVITMLYTNNINGREVAKKLLLSPSMVSQLHRTAIKELKDKIWSVI